MATGDKGGEALVKRPSACGGLQTFALVDAEFFPRTWPATIIVPQLMLAVGPPMVPWERVRFSLSSAQLMTPARPPLQLVFRPVKLCFWRWDLAGNADLGCLTKLQDIP
ncbi:hypothetical protein KFL_001090200 [Klebsormidium nitens]|uniref:Uncharacterized protein n=1 Tax=Klebsormidium nitens TaxID=105231 RepID=A0A1Y1HX68_KLENI|nr:hypothetical protein KFL_001090200 [Klebsormidium nitens]|eukprot:GAQ82372.1 hypothetical protein KFL_001090200 [Klebsormidium nitens]